MPMFSSEWGLLLRHNEDWGFSLNWNPLPTILVRRMDEGCVLHYHFFTFRIIQIVVKIVRNYRTNVVLNRIIVYLRLKDLHIRGPLTKNESVWVFVLLECKAPSKACLFGALANVTEAFSVNKSIEFNWCFGGKTWHLWRPGPTIHLQLWDL